VEKIDARYAGAGCHERHTMNAMLFNATPLLPHAVVQYLAVHLGWGLVLASALVFGARRFGKASRGVILALAVLAQTSYLVSASLPPSYWLGLAFQAPSLVTDLLCIWYLQKVWRGQAASQEPTPGLLAISVVAVLLGWVLLIDTLAWLPWQIYAIGFSPATTAALLFVALLPWMLHGRSVVADARSWIVPLAIGIFVALRWPSGNVWDAILDPWLWLLFNGFVICSIWKRKHAV